MRTRLGWLVTLLLLAVATAWGVERNGFDLSNALVPVAEIHGGGPARDGIPALDQPRFMIAAEATFLTPESRVLGMTRHGIAKAYPLAILNWHEVVNDRFGTEPVVVTFCPLCGTGMAFLATVGDQTLDFGVSGLLYNSDVLLYDRQTESLWSQLLTTAITGPLRGRRLTMLPISHTSWADWRQRYPDTLALSPETGHFRDYGRDPYAGYAHGEQIMFPLRFQSQRFHPKEPVIGLELDGRFKAYPFTELARAETPLRDRIGERVVRVEFDAAHRGGRVLDRSGQELPSVIAFWFAWYAFHPETEVFTAPKTP